MSPQPEWGSGGRRFESDRPDSLKPKLCRDLCGRVFVLPESQLGLRQQAPCLFVGALARDAVPDLAIAELDLRLVSGNDPARQVEKLLRHFARTRIQGGGDTGGDS